MRLSQPFLAENCDIFPSKDDVQAKLLISQDKMDQIKFTAIILLYDLTASCKAPYSTSATVDTKNKSQNL